MKITWAPCFSKTHQEDKSAKPGQEKLYYTLFIFGPWEAFHFLFMRKLPVFIKGPRTRRPGRRTVVAFKTFISPPPPPNLNLGLVNTDGEGEEEGFFLPSKLPFHAKVSCGPN